MLTLINTNRMTPPIAPIGLDYLASALRAPGLASSFWTLASRRTPRRNWPPTSAAGSRNWWG